jgi:hypothetical protein
MVNHLMSSPGTILIDRDICQLVRLFNDNCPYISLEKSVTFPYTFQYKVTAESVAWAQAVLLMTLATQVYGSIVTSHGLHLFENRCLPVAKR